MQWFRMYAEAIDDEKLRLLAFEDRWHFVALLCLKAAGVLDEKDATLRRRKIGVKVGLDSKDLEAAMNRLQAVGLINSRWQPLKWEDRQFISDSSKERTRKYRENKRKNDPGRHGDVTVTRSESDSDSDTESESDKDPLRSKSSQIQNSSSSLGASNPKNVLQTGRREELRIRVNALTRHLTQ